MKARMLSIISGLVLVFILSACAAPIAAPAAQFPAPNDQRRTITVQGNGQVYLTPDLAYVSIGVESRAENVTAALNENNAQATRIAAALREMGVDERDIQTSAFNVYPMQEWTPMGEPAGMVYVVNNTVNITVRNLQTLGELLDGVVRAGANNIQGVTFDVSDKETAMREGRRLAIVNARASAQEMAEAAGVQLGEVITMYVYNVSAPIPIFEGKAYGGMGSASPTVPASAGQMVMTFTADMTFEIE